MSFHLKLELCQYDAALAITGEIKGSSGEKLYQEFGLENWLRRVHLFCKIEKQKFPSLD